MPLAKRLESGSFSMLLLVLTERALSGLFNATKSTEFIVHTRGYNPLAAYTLVLSLYMAYTGTIAALVVPRVHQNRRALGMLLGGLTVVLGFDCMLCTIAGDAVGQTTTLLLVLTALKHAVSATSSRNLVIYSGHVGSSESMADGASHLLREHATRYKLASIVCLVSFGTVVYTLKTASAPWSSRPIVRELGRAQYARALAFVSLLFAVGSEDQTRERGQRKHI